MGKGTGKGKANVAVAAGGGCCACIGIALLITGTVIGGLAAAGVALAPDLIDDAFEKSLVIQECTEVDKDDCEYGQFNTKVTDDMTLNFFSIDNLYDVQTSGATYELSETAVVISVTAISYDLDWTTYEAEDVVTWKRQANYSFDATNEAIATSTLIKQVNPVYLAAIGQKGGYESNIFWGKSYFIMKTVAGFYIDDTMLSLPTLLKYQLWGGWLSQVQETMNMTDATAMAQWSSYAYAQGAGYCTANDNGTYTGAYYGMGCTLEDLAYLQASSAYAANGTACWDGTGTMATDGSEADCSADYLEGWEGGSTGSYGDGATLAATTLTSDQVAWIWSATEAYGVHAGYTYWLGATECAIDDFGTDFTAYEVFTSGYAAYTKYAAAGDDATVLTTCEGAYMIAVFQSGPLSYLETGETGATGAAAYHTLMTLLYEGAYYQDGLFDFAVYGINAATEFDASSCAYWGGFNCLGAMQFANAAPLVAFAGAPSTAFLGETSLQVPSEISVATSYFNNQPLNPVELGYAAATGGSTAPEFMDYQDCSTTRNGCDTIDNLTPLEAMNLLIMSMNSTLNQCIYKAKGLYEVLQEFGYPCSSYDGVTGAGATGYTANSDEAHACASNYSDWIMDYETYPTGAEGSETFDAVIVGMRAEIDASYGFNLINPACQYPLDADHYVDAGLTWDNIVPISTYLHSWIGGEFFLKGTVVGLELVPNALGTYDMPGFPYIGLPSSGVGTANSGLFTERTIMEMISGYNDTLKDSLSSNGFYEGLYGVSNRKFIRPDDEDCDFNTNDECERYGMYTGASDVSDIRKRFYAQGAYEVVERTDLDQECEQKAYPHATIYPYQIHFPLDDTADTYEGYDDCKVWNAPEVIKKSEGAGLAPQYSKFLKSTATSYTTNRDDYEAGPLSFYNSLNARVMNFTSDGTLTSDATLGVSAFKYELDDAMWLNDGTFDSTAMNADNAKYRHTGPNYLMELTSQHGVPLYLSKPYLDGFEGTSHIAGNGNYDATADYSSSMYVEPITGMPIKAEIKLQSNFGIHNKMLDATTLYAEAMANAYAPTQWAASGFETTIVPFFWIEASAMLSQDQADTVTDGLDTIDDIFVVIDGALATGATLTTVGIIILVLGCMGCIGGVAMGSGGKTAPEK